MSSNETQQVGRVAFRREGKLYNAYYALPGTMAGAQFLGSIAMSIVESDPEIHQSFMALMRQVVGNILEAQTGVRPEWPTPPQPAPEHERSGHG